MTKLPKHTLQNIEYSQIKSLLQDNDGTILNYSDYIRDTINNILSRDNKEQLETKDLEEIEKSIEADKPFIEELEYIRRDFSYDFFKSFMKLMKGSDIVYFRAYLYDNYIRNVLRNTGNNNLNSIIELCKTPEQFTILCENRKHETNTRIF